MKEEDIHIGKLISDYLKSHGIKRRWVAMQINTDPSNLSKILKKKHLDTDIIFRISKAVEHNFFTDISNLAK
ncbi:MAG: hypothetical protein HUK15_08135 [Bacteroidales bacterium]|nr:hypothetical protein [Bacteroidales bacterium]